MSDELIDDLAFVLCGIDPKRRTDQATLDSRLSLRDLVQLPNTRFSVSALLFNDHRYLLPHLHDLSDQEFQKRWSQSKEPANGQEATDLIKLVHQVENFQIGTEGQGLSQEQHRDFILKTKEHAIEILLREFRSTRRRIDKALRFKDSHKSARPWHTQFLSKLNKIAHWKISSNLSTLEVRTEIEVDHTLQQITKHYLRLCIQLGRIVRSDVSREDAI